MLRFCKRKLAACRSSNEEDKRKNHELKEENPYLGLLESRRVVGDGEIESNAEDTNKDDEGPDKKAVKGIDNTILPKAASG